MEAIEQGKTSGTRVQAADDRLYRTAAAVLGVDPSEISDESSPDTIPSWDSLNHLNLVMAVEGEYAIALSAEDAMAMGTIGLIRTILRGHGVEV